MLLINLIEQAYIVLKAYWIMSVINIDLTTLVTLKLPLFPI